jgi:DNA-binding beta-propeller fold protein YncE
LGVVQINASTGAPTGLVFGAAGFALGITTDPQTGNLVYVGGDGTILTAPPGGASSTFSTVTTGSVIDGIAFEPTGNFLFVSNKTLNVVTIIDRSGALVQNSGLIPGIPDGISFHATTPKFVLTNNNDGTMTELDFPGDDYTMPPALSVFASGGFRGDLTQVGPDGCIYLTQEGTRFDDGTTSGDNSIVRICPGFAPPPGVLPCGRAPATGCQLGAPGGSSVLLKKNADATKNQLKWKWAKGAATTVTDFKDPVGGSATYSVCVYDGSTNSQPLMDMGVPPGGTCGTKPCWKASGKTGFSFTNKVGTTSGLTTMKLKAGGAGKAQLQAAGKGANLPMPTLGLTLPVTVQLVINDLSSTECWQTTFTMQKKNDAAQFSAKGP